MKPDAARVDTISRVIGNRQIGPSPVEIVEESRSFSFEHLMQVLRLYRPGGWAPSVTVLGREHIDAGLAQGKGVILWVADFAFHGLVLKQALHRHGYAVSHLSGPRHGFSSTRFGMRFLNPIRTRIECRFLHERVVMSDRALPTQRRVLGAMRILRQRLKENRAVSISALATGWGPEKVRLLDGIVRLPAGPPGLAYASGAPLLPVFAVRTTSGAYEVVVAPPLDLHNAPTRKEAVDAAMAGYRELLETYVARYPSQWAGWRHVIAPAVNGSDSSPNA